MISKVIYFQALGEFNAILTQNIYLYMEGNYVPYMLANFTANLNSVAMAVLHLIIFSLGILFNIYPLHKYYGF